MKRFDHYILVLMPGKRHEVRNGVSHDWPHTCGIALLLPFLSKNKRRNKMKEARGVGLKIYNSYRQCQNLQSHVH